MYSQGNHEGISKHTSKAMSKGTSKGMSRGMPQGMSKGIPKVHLTVPNLMVWSSGGPGCFGADFQEIRTGSKSITSIINDEPNLMDWSALGAPGGFGTDFQEIKSVVNIVHFYYTGTTSTTSSTSTTSISALKVSLKVSLRYR